MMETLQKVNFGLDKFSWVDYNYYPDSKGLKFEVYSNSFEKNIESLIKIFYYLFRDNLSELVIGQSAPDIGWGQFCIDTWNFEIDEPNYNLENKSFETLNYLNLLLDSKIEFSYQGICKCNDWNKFLFVTLDCIINHKAPYSPLFYDLKNDYFFYFHHSFSIGLFYREKNVAIISILDKIKANNQLSFDQK